MSVAYRHTGILISLLLLSPILKSQKVGLVLSGGGATALAHVGVIKALEEDSIPIDYIAGTSMGAMVGAMYASGYSPEEMETFFTSDDFRRMTKGAFEDDFKYYFKEKNVDASWITVKLSDDKILETSLPTSVISSVPVDYRLMEDLSQASAAANDNFDSLLVPFRCVAADIEDKDIVVFSDGPLSRAVRASMSYPFYLKPLKINGHLLFDGGLYNNFPSDVMYNTFFPDLILGSNVSSNFDPPDEDNVISQIKTMLVSKTNFSVLCDNGICIQPEVKAGTFDFSDIGQIVEQGYKEAKDNIQAIKQAVNRRVSPEQMAQKRAMFKKKEPELLFDGITVDGLKRGQIKYVRSVLSKRKKTSFTVTELKKPYFRVFEDDKIASIYPIANYNDSTGKFNLHLDIKKDKNIFLDFGGNFSSRPINTAYLGVRYNLLGRAGATLGGNFYFGKLYGSAQIKARFDLPVRTPLFLEGEFTRNRWDYFKSQATFFEEVKPSYLVTGETFYGVNVGVPVPNNGRIIAGVNAGTIDNQYYLTSDFVLSDTVDHTDFSFNSVFFKLEHSTLNRKQYPNSGAYFSISGSYVQGDEHHEPGSTSNFSRNFSRWHEWYLGKLKFIHYYKGSGFLRLGLSLDFLYSNQQMFNNYTATLLAAPAYTPTPESKTRFLESFRSMQYGAIGQMVVFNIKERVDIRLEGYLFQPIQAIELNTDGNTASLGLPLQKRYTIATGAFVFHSPLGPVSASVNYYHNNPEIAPEDKTPITFLFHFGYVIFNHAAILN